MTELADAIYNKGFCIIDNFLDPIHYKKLRETAELMHSKGDFKQAKIGSLLHSVHLKAIRNDTICWLDEDAANDSLQAFFLKIRELAHLLNQSLFLGLVDFESHFSIYQPGSFYKKHIDQFKTTQDRRISCVYYLNENWQESSAGQLKLYDKENQLLAEVLPLANRFICFNSDLPHEVCQTKETRFSIAGWMKVRSNFNFIRV